MKRPRRDHDREAGVETETTIRNEEGDHGEEEYTSSSSILCLPEACLAHVISLTTPLDACCSSAVSTAFQAAASSDSVWECFLPMGYHSILARADHPVDLTSTKKELFLSLAQDHILLDQGTKSFWLERTSGAKCYMLSSSSLEIIWGEYPIYWRRIYSLDSRFEEVAELIAVCWLNVSGRIDSGELSPNTKYAAYLVFNLEDESYGLNCPTQEAFITIGDQIASAKRTVSLHPHTAQGGGGGGADEESITVSYPRERDDSWMEVELGEFYSHQEDTGILIISLIEHVQLHWKKGLICDGIEIRPKT